MQYYPKPATKQCTKKILEQMETSFYTVKDKKGNKGIGIFCNIKYENKNIQVIIINNCKFGEGYNNILYISKNAKEAEIELLYLRYINKELNISIIEVKENKKDKIKYMEIDDKLFDKNFEMLYNDESIYIIQYSNENNIFLSYGVITNTNTYQMRYYCNIHQHSRFSLIFNLSNNKLIGFHERNNNIYNKGKFINLIIDEFIHKNLNNEIDILIKVDKVDIDKNKQIYFLDNFEYKDEEGKKHIHDKLEELNEYNTELYINDIKQDKYKKYFIPKIVKDYKIKLKFNVNLVDSSYMFAGCENIININFISFNTKYITNMNYMFLKCKNLKSINLLFFDTRNVLSMRSMFNECYNLKDLDLSSFNTKNVNNMRCMFRCCENVKNLDLSSFNTKLVNDMRCMFRQCKNLTNLNISNFINEKVNNMGFMFRDCQNLINLDLFGFYAQNVTDLSSMFENCNNLEFLDLSRFNTKNVTNMEYMFNKCNNLKSLDLSSFNTQNVTNMERMFCDCYNLINLNLSNLNTNNVLNMYCMFYACKNLKNIDLSSFNTKNVNNMSYMFSNCERLTNLDLSKFDTQNVTNMECMFQTCSSLISLDLSKFDTKKVKDMHCMFNNCIKLNTLNLSSFNTENVTNVDYIFHDCKQKIIDANKSKFKKFNYNELIEL